MTIAPLPVILLAAGASTRMRGRDKLMEDIGGEPLLRRQARLARGIGPVTVALPPAPHPRYTALSGLDITPLPIPDAAEGMGASLRRAFAALPLDTPAAMVLLADMPALEARDLARLAAAVDLTGETLIWRATTEDGKPGHPIVFAAALFDQLKQLRGDDGGRAVVRAAADRMQLVPLPGQRARRDLDTPEDWAAWRAEQE
ncbi:nucleotidyltransferase family protein [Sulfitobacter sp. KE29]|nr:MULTISPECIES: nucleotidyltransferase family protein [unclassified Sulfitobacter]MBO9437260.1 nucleotidyltransferase family protein [Sulfitobacter sp. R18_2]MDF3419246.1 nucleotidyltransferase family protein [Sulfitobacter sp. Ks38]MDF3426728.1 nucleotidyltransferase family protein [Sulfitobacter sp. KE29]MDF3430309.1 nucleotidyltransferase family protein [Sulfitobacter sp. S46]MDF3445081.1 nucleotidyltransferase family protein [Sulfitobacter sp. KE31]